jgi:hypothetical protein
MDLIGELREAKPWFLVLDLAEVCSGQWDTGSGEFIEMRSSKVLVF